MPRSVVLAGTNRCSRCQMPPRWCICAGFQPVESPIQVDVLIHNREFWRPTSTGRLINRLIPSSRGHVFFPDGPPAQESIVQPGKTVWILHPRGDPLPADPVPADVQVLLLDGSWPEAARMHRTVERWGRGINLPMTGPSRYWLRTQQGEGMHSTIEALMYLHAALGLVDIERKLRLQFELSVYAGLRARGAKEAAARYLETSPIREAFPELLQQLDQRRPLVQE